MDKEFLELKNNLQYLKKDCQDLLDKKRISKKIKNVWMVKVGDYFLRSCSIGCSTKKGRYFWHNKSGATNTLIYFLQSILWELKNKNYQVYDYLTGTYSIHYIIQVLQTIGYIKYIKIDIQQAIKNNI